MRGLLWFALVWTAGCNSLWSAFQDPNPENCVVNPQACSSDQTCNRATKRCESPAAIDLAGIDLTMIDMAGVDHSPASAWTVSTSNTTVDLRGISGGPGATAGSNDIWAVGSGGVATYASSSSGIFSPFVVAGNNTLAMTRVAYIDKGLAAALTSAAVFFLTPTAGNLVNPQPSGGPFSGLAASSQSVSTVYVLANQSTVYSLALSGTPMWTAAVAPAGAVNGVNALSGTLRGASFELWAAMSGSQEFYNINNIWTFAGGLPTFASVWATPRAGGVYYVGSAGRIAYANIVGGPTMLTALNVTTTANLRDVAGTPDGQHIFAVGDGGKILRCDLPPCATGWTDEPSGTSTNLYGVWASATDVWAVGDGGLILHRTLVGP